MRARFLVVSAVALGFVISACGDDTTSPNGGGEFEAFTPADKAALITVLRALAEDGVDPDTLEVGVDFDSIADLASDILGYVEQIGSLNSTMNAFAIEIRFSVTEEGQTQTGAGASVIAWSNLQASTSSLDGFLTAGGLRANATTFTGSVTITDSIADDATEAGIAAYYQAATMSFYRGSSGTFTVSSATFNGTPRNCTYVVQGVSVQCTAVSGRMTGSFNFVADLLSGTGSATFTQGNTSFDLPAVSYTLQSSQ